MTSRLIELIDGVLIEVEVPSDAAQQISGNLAEKVQSTLDKIRPVLVNACIAMNATWKEVSQNMYLEQAEIELGLSFEMEGNVYIAKGKTGSNLNVKLTFKRN